ncbi:MAG: hypothetical protein IPM23_03715 [Candidatus Melainabacteria bacterium]|nr:hypothetical protein [Candidatus Melainabacteria bacterium]
MTIAQHVDSDRRTDHFEVVCHNIALTIEINRPITIKATTANPLGAFAK